MFFTLQLRRLGSAGVILVSALLLAATGEKAWAANICVTNSECFASCCPSGQPTCSQTCRNTCGNYPTECPDYYYFCKYNTYAADYNFLEISSNSPADMQTEVTYLNDIGYPIDNPNTFLLIAMRRVDFDVHSVVGPRHYGQIRVGIYSSQPLLQAAVSYYRADMLQTAYVPCVGYSRSQLNSAE